MRVCSTTSDTSLLNTLACGREN